MRIHHLVTAANIDDHGYIINPLEVRHGLIVAGRIAELAGMIDPLTHLNLDMPDHGVDGCLVVETMTIGAAVVWQGDHFLLASPRPNAYQRRGRRGRG